VVLGQVFGNDHAGRSRGLQGQIPMNVINRSCCTTSHVDRTHLKVPLLFPKAAQGGLSQNEKRLKETSTIIMLVTAPASAHGYERRQISRSPSYREDQNLREASLKLGFPQRKQVDSWVRRKDRTHPLCETPCEVLVIVRMP